MELFLALTVTLHSVHCSHMIKIHCRTCEISLLCGNSPLSRCACLVESFPPWLNWYVLDYGVFFWLPPPFCVLCVRYVCVCVCVSISNSLLFLFSCAAVSQYLSWELPGLKEAAFKDPKLDRSCLLIFFQVHTGHLEFIMIGISDRMGEMDNKNLLLVWRRR